MTFTVAFAVYLVALFFTTRKEVPRGQDPCLIHLWVSLQEEMGMSEVPNCATKCQKAGESTG